MLQVSTDMLQLDVDHAGVNVFFGVASDEAPFFFVSVDAACACSSSVGWMTPSPQMSDFDGLLGLAMASRIGTSTVFNAMVQQIGVSVSRRACGVWREPRAN
jgi:hypothetical protein